MPSLLCVLRSPRKLMEFLPGEPEKSKGDEEQTHEYFS